MHYPGIEGIGVYMGNRIRVLLRILCPGSYIPKALILPLTLDYGAVLQIMGSLVTSIVPPGLALAISVSPEPGTASNETLLIAASAFVYCII